jgi:hypothetical protein
MYQRVNAVKAMVALPIVATGQIVEAVSPSFPSTFFNLRLETAPQKFSRALMAGIVRTNVVIKSSRNASANPCLRYCVT